jgi:hypothetical protein
VVYAGAYETGGCYYDRATGAIFELRKVRGGIKDGRTIFDLDPPSGGERYGLS